MTLAELIRKAIDIAVSGTNPDSNILQSMSLEAEVLADQALDELASEVAGNPELRGRLERVSTVTLVSGVGVIPAGMLVEYLREGSVTDSDIGSSGYGNVLQRVKYLNDFIGYLPSVYGYYIVNDNQFLTRQISSGDFTATVGPLKIHAPFVPDKTTINTDVPDEIETELLDLLAIKLRGIIARMTPSGQ